MGSVNIADSTLEELTCEDGNPESELEWDKSNESFTDFFERILRRAEKNGQALSEKDLELIEGRVDAIFQDYAR